MVTTSNQQSTNENQNTKASSVCTLSNPRVVCQRAWLSVVSEGMAVSSVRGHGLSVVSEGMAVSSVRGHGCPVVSEGMAVSSVRGHGCQ